MHIIPSIACRALVCSEWQAAKNQAQSSAPESPNHASGRKLARGPCLAPSILLATILSTSAHGGGNGRCCARWPFATFWTECVSCGLLLVLVSVLALACSARAGRSQLFGPSVSLAACCWCWCWCWCWRLLALRALAVRNFADRAFPLRLAACARAVAGVGARSLARLLLLLLVVLLVLVLLAASCGGRS